MIAFVEVILYDLIIFNKVTVVQLFAHLVHFHPSGKLSCANLQSLPVPILASHSLLVFFLSRFAFLAHSIHKESFTMWPPVFGFSLSVIFYCYLCFSPYQYSISKLYSFCWSNTFCLFVSWWTFGLLSLPICSCMLLFEFLFLFILLERERDRLIHLRFLT